MDSSNPYDAPSTATRRAPAARPHSASLWIEAWRGAKFGGKAMGLVMGAVLCAALAILVFVDMRQRLVHGESAFKDAELADIALGAVWFAVLTSFYSAVGGALIMSVAAIVRRRRSARRQDGSQG